MSTPDSTRLWGGRFASGPSDAMAALSLSVHFDWRLAPYDIAQTRAHARVLNAAGLLDDAEVAQVEQALTALAEDVASGAAQPIPADEDVHTAIERLLLDRLGSLGGKLRAGRSRNDQVSTDFRLYLRDEARRIAGEVVDLQQALLDQSNAMVDVIAPGFTHLQHAQPVAILRAAGRIPCVALGVGQLGGSLVGMFDAFAMGAGLEGD